MAVKNIKSKKNDTGATEVQIKIFTERITTINNHLKTMNIPIGPAAVLRYNISLYRNGK